MDPDQLSVEIVAKFDDEEGKIDALLNYFCYSSRELLLKSRESLENALQGHDYYDDVNFFFLCKRMRKKYFCKLPRTRREKNKWESLVSTKRSSELLS